MEEVQIVRDKENKDEGKVYLFSNENVTSFNNIYNFKGARILSAIGSGDQYFGSMLYGAKSVDLFDIKEKSVYYFLLKYISIKVLSYEEFIKFYMQNLDDIEVYKSLRDFLPICASNYFDNLYKNNQLFSSWLINPFTSVSKTNVRLKRIIPYFNIENYYKLQSILKLRDTYPHFYVLDIRKLFNELSSEYDIMLFSNIFAWLDMTEKDYLKMLRKKYFRFLSEKGVIQMFYNWEEWKTFNKFNGIVRNSVESAGNPSLKDYVFSLKKK